MTECHTAHKRSGVAHVKHNGWFITVKYYKNSYPGFEKFEKAVIYAYADCWYCGAPFHHHAVLAEKTIEANEYDKIYKTVMEIADKVQDFQFPKYCEHCGKQMED